MSITMSSNVGRKGKRGPSSPTASIHSPPTTLSPLPKIKLNIRSNNTYSRPSSASSRSRASGSGTQRRDVFSDDSSSDLTPADDDDEDDDDNDDDVYPLQAPRKSKKRESLPLAQPSATKDKGKGKATASPANAKKATAPDRASPSRPSAHGPSGRDRKRHIKLGEVARRRARDDKFGFGGADRFSSATPTHSRIPKTSAIDSDSTSSYGDDESERENTQSLYGDDETEDEAMGGLHEAFAGQEIEDLAYGAGHPDSSMEDEAAWWYEAGPDDDEEDNNEDEEFIAQLTGSDIEGLQSQSSVHASSDDPMSEASSSEDDDVMDEFGFPAPFGSNVATGSDQPLVLMENWDGQFVLVQPRNDRSQRRNRGSQSASGSRTAGSVGESTSLSAGENNLIVDPDADSDDSSGWSGMDDDEDDGGDTTDSMCEDDMPVLNSPALDQIVAQQMANGFELDLDFIASLPLPASLIETATAMMESSKEAQEAALANPSIVITDPSGEGVSPGLSSASPASSAQTPAVLETVSEMAAPVMLPQTLHMAPPPPPVAPVMGVFSVSDEPCAHAVIDGSKTTTKSPFTRRRRHAPSETGSVGPSKRRSSRVSANGGDPFSPAVKKTRYSSIPGHPRYIAARRAAQIVDPLDRDTTPSEEEEAFSLDDMLDASMLPMNELESTTPQSPELRHLFRFDKVPVSMYMRRNFSSASRNRTQPPAPALFSPQRDQGLTGTLAGPLAHPASRMLISPLLQPANEPMSRKERRKARKEMETLKI